MKPHTSLFGIALVVAAVLAGTLVWKSTATPALAAASVGQPLPAFELSDVGGTKHALAQYKGRITVIEFSNINCPYSQGTDPQLIALAAAYAEKGVVVLSIDSNAPNSTDQIKKYADEKGKNFPILKDEGAKYADTMAAKVTPEVFVVDKEGVLAYHGAFDNRTQPDKKGDVAYVENAVKALLEGKAVEPKEVKAWGCGIKRVPK